MIKDAGLKRGKKQETRVKKQEAPFGFAQRRNFKRRETQEPRFNCVWSLSGVEAPDSKCINQEQISQPWVRGICAKKIIRAIRGCKLALDKLTLPARKEAHAQQDHAMLKARNVGFAIGAFAVTDGYFHNF